jgi:hypothetical protein
MSQQKQQQPEKLQQQQQISDANAIVAEAKPVVPVTTARATTDTVIAIL